MPFEFTDKHILIISPEPWDHVFVSKHHYALQLAIHNNKIYFLNPPESVNSIAETDHSNVFLVKYTGFPKGLRFYPKFIRKYFQRKVLRRIEALGLISFDVIWSFDNSVFFDLDSFNDATLKISHIVDFTTDYQFIRASRSADICFSSSRFILEKQLKFNPRSYFINHGFADDHKKKPLLTSLSSGLKVGYSGNLNIPYIDWELINKIMTDHHEIQFYFAGSKSGTVPVEGLSNFNYVGLLNKPELQWFLNQMDVLILVYQADKFPYQLANPHKMLEYLATGKPIVATYTAEYKGSDLIYMSAENSGWLRLFDEAVSNVGKEAEVIIRKRMKVAFENTYNKQLKRIEKYING